MSLNVIQWDEKKRMQSRMISQNFNCKQRGHAKMTTKSCFPYTHGIEITAHKKNASSPDKLVLENHTPKVEKYISLKKNKKFGVKFFVLACWRFSFSKIEKKNKLNDLQCVLNK